MSALVSREVLKWRHWVDQTTDVPTVDGPPFNTHTPGLYRGSKYCDELYRPTPNSKMRSLGRPFDAINEEALVLRMYSVVSPIDNVFPAIGTVNVDGLSPENFVVQSPTPAAHRLMLEWYVGDQLVQTGGDFDPGRLPQGQSVVTALVYDAVAKVRRDDAGSLAGEHAWTVDKSGPEQPITAVFDGVHNSLAIPVVQLSADNTMFQVKLQLVSDRRHPAILGYYVADRSPGIFRRVVPGKLCPDRRGGHDFRTCQCRAGALRLFAQQQGLNGDGGYISCLLSPRPGIRSRAVPAASATEPADTWQSTAQ